MLVLIITSPLGAAAPGAVVIIQVPIDININITDNNEAYHGNGNYHDMPGPASALLFQIITPDIPPESRNSMPIHLCPTIWNYHGGVITTLAI